MLISVLKMAQNNSIMQTDVFVKHKPLHKISIYKTSCTYKCFSMIMGSSIQKEYKLYNLWPMPSIDKNVPKIKYMHAKARSSFLNFHNIPYVVLIQLMF